MISDWIAQQKGFVLNEERYTTFEPASAVTASRMPYKKAAS